MKCKVPSMESFKEIYTVTFFEMEILKLAQCNAQSNLNCCKIRAF